MKIIENNYKKEKPIHLTCPHCHSIIEINREESKQLALTCPCCHKQIQLIQTITEDVKMTTSLPIKVNECGECGADFWVHPNDITYKELGIAYCICPYCKNETEVDIDGKYDLNLTKYNLEYPKHFYHFSQYEKAAHLSDEEIMKYIQECIKHLDETNDKSWSIQTGDAKVEVELGEEDNEYDIYVSRDFYSTTINNMRY